MPIMTRRHFLTFSAIAGGATATGGLLLSPPSLAKTNPLLIPPLIDARQQIGPIELTAQAGETHFYPNTPSFTAGYNGHFLGPTIRVHRGDDVELSIKNTLNEATSIHWHGLLIPAELDGGPHQLIAPRETWQPVLPIRQKAASLWYHSHVHGRTAAQVYAGLAGMMIVTDEEEQALDLPSDYGVNDLPLILQDRHFINNEMQLSNNMMDIMHGRRGETFLVNGTLQPYAEIPRGWVRLRLLNGANARSFALSFSDKRSFYWIASEGGLLEQPVALTQLSLIPGERAEILVDFSDGALVSLVTQDDTSMPMMGMFNRAKNLVLSGSSLVTFQPTESSAPFKLPIKLTSLPTVMPDIAVRERSFHMNMGMNGFGINGQSFSMKRINEQVKLGSSEIWHLSGDMMGHPFHIHGVHFRVIARGGKKPLVRDQGLKDTVWVNEPVSVLVNFDFPAKQAPFMYHCHILEHEDNGMMGQFKVV